MFVTSLIFAQLHPSVNENTEACPPTVLSAGRSKSFHKILGFSKCCETELTKTICRRAPDDELWAKVMGRKCENAGMLHFGGIFIWHFFIFGFKT